MASKLDTLLWYIFLILAKSLFFQEVARMGILIEFKLLGFFFSGVLDM
jgi:hypothetical protein